MANIPETVSIDNFGGKETSTIAYSLMGMAKDPSRYAWKSEKQANFFLNLYRRAEGINNMWVKDPPPGTEMIFFVELHIDGIGDTRFGRKSRRKARILFMNRNGILRVDEVKFEYNDRQGSSGIKNIERGQPTSISPETKPEAEKPKPQWQVDKEKMQTSSQHIGNVGEKIERELTLTKTIGPFDTKFGSMYINLLSDGSNVFVYAGRPIDMDQNQKALIKFTIKKHDERDGTKQTVISRPKIIKIIDDKEATEMPIKETFDSKKYMLNKKLKDAKKNTPKDEDDAEVVNKGGDKDVYESENKRPIFEKYQALYESKTSEQISRSLGYLLSIAGDAKTLHAGIKQSEPMLNEKLVKKLAAVLHVISKIKSGQAPNEAPSKSEKSEKSDTEDKGEK